MSLWSALVVLNMITVDWVICRVVYSRHHVGITVFTVMLSSLKLCSRADVTMGGHHSEKAYGML